MLCDEADVAFAIKDARENGVQWYHVVGAVTPLLAVAWLKAINAKGPREGLVEVSRNYPKAAANLRELLVKRRRRQTEFVFNPAEQRVVAGRAKHNEIANASGMNPKDPQIVGGEMRMTSANSNCILSQEKSGSFGENWTSELAEEFVAFMKANGVNVTHRRGVRWW